MATTLLPCMHSGPRAPEWCTIRTATFSPTRTLWHRPTVTVRTSLRCWSHCMMGRCCVGGWSAWTGAGAGPPLQEGQMLRGRVVSMDRCGGGSPPAGRADAAWEGGQHGQVGMRSRGQRTMLSSSQAWWAHDRWLQQGGRGGQVKVHVLKPSRKGLHLPPLISVSVLSYLGRWLCHRLSRYLTIKS